MILEIDILSQILNVGGILSFALASGMIVLWKEYLKEKKEKADLNAIMRKDAVDNIRIIDTLNNLIKSHQENDRELLEKVSEVLTIIKTKYSSRLEV